MRYYIQKKPFLKILLHALRYPFKPIFGLILGRRIAKAPKEGASEIVEILDVLPLFHSNILTPMLELALMVCNEKATSEGIDLIGCYSANEHLRFNEPSQVVLQVASTLRKQCSFACLIQISNIAVGQREFNNMLQLYLAPNGSNWTCKELKLIYAEKNDEYNEEEEESSIARLAQSLERLLVSHKQEFIEDFQNHLTDPSKDPFTTIFEL